MIGKQLILITFLLPTLLFAQTKNNADKKTDYSQKIKGRFVLKGASCAGFEFIDDKKIIWRNELTCFTPDTLAIFWLDNSTFITKDIKRENENCPPRNWLYKVDYFDDQNLKLIEIWTGWGDYKTDNLKFTRWIDKK